LINARVDPPVGNGIWTTTPATRGRG